MSHYKPHFPLIILISLLIKDIVGGSKMSNVLKAKDDLLKTPEQLEAEKKEIIGARTVKLRLEGKSKQDLIQDVTINLKN
jgi:hypothetical protein